MQSFSIITLGCKVNQYESQQIRQLLEGFGLCHNPKSEKNTDLCIINTCCVTHTASSKSRNYIRRIQKANPSSTIVVIGCLPVAQMGELHGLDKNIHIIQNRKNLIKSLRQIVHKTLFNKDLQINKIPVNISIKTQDIIEIKDNQAILDKLPELTNFKGQTRAFLKVQDGCDGYCSYCIIPKTRSEIENKPKEAVLKEAEQLTAAGHKEIILTGIFLGAYGQNTVRRKKWYKKNIDALPKLLAEMVRIPKLYRIRLSSLEPADVTDKLLDVYCKYLKIMPHFHLSLQSGSDKILKTMCRQYRIDDFLEIVEKINKKLDKPALTTDLIAGFPGETDDDFGQTVEIAKKAGFAKMHIFAFSPRKGTAAAEMKNKVDANIISERSKILRKLDTELATKFRQQFVGKTISVLTEESDGRIYGRAERYFEVELPQDKPIVNQIYDVKIIANEKESAVGKII